MPATAGRSDWRRLLAVFWLTSLVEGLGTSQVFALLPLQLHTMGVTGSDRLAFVGLFGSLLFVLGLPLVPLWGVWADRYSRKAVIVRSALVEMGVFAGMALAREPWQVALCILGIGFQLGNTGIMLGAIRDASPKHRLGTILSVFGASGPVGFATGPLLAGVLIDGFGWSLSAVFALSALLSLGTAALVTLGSREVRPEVVPQGRAIHLAFGALRNVVSDRAVRSIFIVFGLAFLANQMSRGYVPVLVESIVGLGPGLASSIGLVAGTATLAGALLAPFTGALGDRIGFRPVLATAFLSGGLTMAAMPLLGSVLGLPVLVALAVLLAASASTISAMVFALLGTEVAPERRSQTLNLAYLPLYLAGIVGPAVGAAVSTIGGIAGPFLLGGLVFGLGSIAVLRRRPIVPVP